MADILARNLSRRFGKKIKVVPVGVKSNERIPFVLSGKIDVEMGSTTHTAKRDEVVDFSLIYFISETTFLTRKTSGISTLTDLYDKKDRHYKRDEHLRADIKICRKGLF